MTRIWLPALILVFILSLPVQASSQEVKVILDGKELGLEPPARVEKGHVLVPVASFLAALGGEVVCEGEGGEVIGRWEDIELVIPLGCTEIIVNGEERELAVPAKSVAGCIYIPLRQLADVLGGEPDLELCFRNPFLGHGLPGGARGEGKDQHQFCFGPKIAGSDGDRRGPGPGHS